MNKNNKQQRPTRAQQQQAERKEARQPKTREVKPEEVAAQEPDANVEAKEPVREAPITPNASFPPVEVKPAPTTDELNNSVLDNMGKALKSGNITQEEFDSFAEQMVLVKSNIVSAPDAPTYRTTINQLMDTYEKNLPINKILERSETVRVQRSLWGIITTCINQEDYNLFKEGYQTILKRMKGTHYGIQYLYRGLANPVDPSPVLDSYTIRLYTLLILTVNKGRKGAMSNLDLDETIDGMSSIAKNNLVAFYSA